MKIFQTQETCKKGLILMLERPLDSSKYQLIFQRLWVKTKHPYGDSQPAGTPVLGDLTSILASSGTTHVCSIKSNIQLNCT